MLLVVSTIFIACFLPTVVNMMLAAFIDGYQVGGTKEHMLFAFLTFTILLEGINSTVNIFVYLSMSSKYKQAFVSLFLNQAGKRKKRS